MNPKGANDLDPKLKEAYDRIMGTSFTPSAPPNPIAGNPNAPKDQPPAAPQQPAQPPSSNTPLMQTQVYTPTSAPENNQTNSSQVFTQSNSQPLSSVFSQSPSNEPVVKKKKLNLLPLLLVFGGIIFLIIYVVVWAKVFSLF